MKKLLLLAALAGLAAAQMPYPPVPPGTCQTVPYCDQFGCRWITICH